MNEYLGDRYLGQYGQSAAEGYKADVERMVSPANQAKSEGWAATVAFMNEQFKSVNSYDEKILIDSAVKLKPFFGDKTRDTFLETRFSEAFPFEKIYSTVTLKEGDQLSVASPCVSISFRSEEAMEEVMAILGDKAEKPSEKATPKGEPYSIRVYGEPREVMQLLEEKDVLPEAIAKTFVENSNYLPRREDRITHVAQQKYRDEQRANGQGGGASL